MSLPKIEGTTDPGSYTAGEPFDTFDVTMVPLRTPHGPVTLWFSGTDRVYATSGYQEHEYGNRGTELFTWKDRGVIGAEHFYAAAGWMPDYGPGGIVTTDFTCRKMAYGQGSVTARMTEDIIAYWSAVIKRYVTENPGIPAHAEFRAAVRSLAKKDEAIAGAEQELARMRKERRGIRADVRRTLIAAAAIEGSSLSLLSLPRPYPHETASGYVTELENDRDIYQEIKNRRAALAEQEK